MLHLTATAVATALSMGLSPQGSVSSLDARSAGGIPSTGSVAEVGPVGAWGFPRRSLVRRLDQLDRASNGGDWYKNYNNETATLAWGESYVMMAYLAAYESTGSLYYLRKMADHADHVLLSRDDVRGVSDYRGASGACWRNLHYQTNDVPYCYAVHSGMITFPMARFAAMVLDDPALHGILALDSTTFLDKANYYVERVAETIDAHDWEWRNGPGSGEGYYRFPDDAPPPIYQGRNQPSNQQNALGRTLVAMHHCTGDPAYLDKAERLATLFVRSVDYQGDAFVWDYWNFLGDYGYDGPGEDISHAGINVDFCVRAFEEGAVVDAGDLDALVATFTDLVTAGDGEVYRNVDGTGDIGVPGYEEQVGRWLNLSFRDEVSAMYFTIQGVNEDIFDLSAMSGSQFTGVANLALWESSMSLRGINISPGDGSDWADITAADLDGDGIDELVAARNFDGTIYAYRLDTVSGGVTSWGVLRGFSSDIAWAGLGAGDLDGDGKDEIVAVDNRDGNLHFIDSPASGVLEVTGEYTGWGPASQWAGLGVARFEKEARPWVALVRNFDANVFLIDYDMSGQGTVMASSAAFGANSNFADLTCGDYDGDGQAEIAVVRNFDATLFVLDYTGSELPIIANTTGFGPASDWAALASADLDGIGGDEIIGVRNFDGGLFRWSLQGNQLKNEGRDSVYGASKAWAALSGGRYARRWPTDMLAGASNRTGHLFFYGLGSGGR